MKLTGKLNNLFFDFSTGKTLLSLEVNEKEIAKAGYDELHLCENVDIVIKKHRKKRSLNANAYAWVLMTKIAESLGITKEEIYKKYIKEIGVCRQVEISEKAVDTLKHIWEDKGTGWIIEIMDYGEHEGFILATLYYGSSLYTTKQMSRLIDSIVQDCKALGIETMTDTEIERLKRLWKSEKSNG